MGWRDLSEDAQHVAFWGTFALAIGGGIAAGTYLGYWNYFWAMPDLRILIALAAADLAFVGVYFSAFLTHRYFNFPKRHPFYSVIVSPIPVPALPRPEPLALPVPEQQEPELQEPPPNITWQMFQGEQVGLEVANTGGKCRVKGKIQLLSCSGRDCQIRKHERFDACWLNKIGAAPTFEPGDDASARILGAETTTSFLSCMVTTKKSSHGHFPIGSSARHR